MKRFAHADPGYDREELTSAGRAPRGLRGIVITCALAIALGLSAISCGDSKKAGAPSPVSPASTTLYQKNGVSFSYPSEWKVEEDTEEAGARSIVLDIPGGGFLQITKLPPAVKTSLDEFAREISKNHESGFKEKGIRINGFTSGKTQARIAGNTRDGIVQNYDLTALNEPLRVRLRFFSMETGGGPAFLVDYSDVEDLAKEEPGFQAVYDSIKFDARKGAANIVAGSQ